MPDAAGSARALLAECATLAAEIGDARVASAAREELLRLDSGAERPPVVLVVGATKAGKSSLVNALLRTPGLSPVDASVATNACVEFVHAERRFARVYMREPGETREIAVERLRDWITEQGNPGNTRGVKSVEVGLDVALLQRVTIVDTAGAGADREHLASTLMAIGLADALLFIADAQRELSASALDFLRRASQRVDTVIVAVTKTDQHYGSAEILAANRRLLIEHEPRFADAPMVLVSSRLAAAGHAAAEPLATQLGEQSGLLELEALIDRHVVARRAELGVANGTTHAVTLLSVLQRRIAERQAAITGTTRAFRADAEAEAERLRAAQNQAAEWREHLTAGIGEVRAERWAAFETTLNELAGEYCRPSSEDIDRRFDHLEEELIAASERLLRGTAADVHVLVGRIVGELERGSRLDEVLAELNAQHVAITVEAPANVRPAAPDSFEKVVGLAAPASPLISTGASAVGATAFPVGAVVAMTAYLVVEFRRHRQKTAQREALADAIRDQIARTRRQVRDTHDDRLTGLRRAADAHVSGLVELRIAELGDLVDAHDDAQRRTATERQRQSDELTGVLERVRAAAERAQQLIAPRRGAP